MFDSYSIKKNSQKHATVTNMITIFAKIIKSTDYRTKIKYFHVHRFGNTATLNSTSSTEVRRYVASSNIIHAYGIPKGYLKRMAY